MNILILVIGIVLMVLSTKAMFGDFAKNEWRAPLLELTANLEGGSSEMEQVKVRRRAASIVIFHLVLFGIGGFIILKTPLLQNYIHIILIALIVISFWPLKGAYEIIRAFYSRKVRLLNYLFSPYLFAWRRDFLNKYSDQEIENAICNVCDVRDRGIIQKNTSLKDFLIALHRKTRPYIEQSTYPKVLEENIARAEKELRLI